MSQANPRFDVVVIGAGPGGYVCAIRAAQMGFKTAIVEGHRMGGECLNYGCIPSKALITATHNLDRAKHGDKMGIMVTGLSVDMNKLIDWKTGIVKQLTNGVGSLLKSNGVTVFKGTGGFESISQDGKIKTIRVDGAVDSHTGQKVEGATQLIEAERVVIATGSTSVQIPSMPFNAKTILNSQDALEVRTIPKKIVVIGGGVIGLELGSVFQKLGTEVIVVEGTAQLLPGTDKERVDVVGKKLIKNGAKIHLNTKALGVKETGKGVLVSVEGPAAGTNGGTPVKTDIEADWVLVTVGRKPRTGGLTPEKIGLKLSDRGFVKVNGRLETEVPGVYAIGDVIGGPMLAHKASSEGLIVVECMMNPGRHVDIRALPAAIFVDPEIAVVGHSEETAKAAGWDPVVGKCPFVANGRALTTGEAEGFVKIIADRKTDRVLGAHMVGPEVSNLVAEIALAIEMGATVEDVARTVHTHPSLPEVMMEAAESVHGMAVHFFEKKPRTHKELHV